MKIFTLRALFFILALIKYETSVAQWQLVGPNKTTIAHEVSVNHSIVISNNAAGGLFVSEDGGNNWKNEGDQINKDPVAILLSDGQRLYCSTGYNVYESDDNGNTWYSILFNISLTPIRQIYLFGSRLFAVTQNELFYKDPGQAEWQTALNNYGTGKSQDFILFKQDDTLFFLIQYSDSYNSTEYISYDSGASWVLQPPGEYFVLPNKPGFWIEDDSVFYFSSSTKKEIDALGTDYIYSYAEPTFFFAVHDSGGRNQYVAEYDTSGNKKYVDSALNETGAVITIFSVNDTLYEFKNFKLYKSGDNGDHWNFTDAQGLYGMNVRFFSSIDSTYYAGTDLGVFTSNDSGANWRNLQNDSLPDFTNYYNPLIPYGYGTGFIEQFPVDLFNVKDTIYLATFDSGIYRSIDEGTTWKAAGFNHTPDLRFNFLLQGDASYYYSINKLAKSPLFAGLLSNGLNTSASLYIKGVNTPSWILLDHDIYNQNYTFGREVTFSKYPALFPSYYFIANQQLTQQGKPSIDYHANSFFIDTISNFYICAQEGLFKYLWSFQSEYASSYTITNVANNLPQAARWVNDGFILGSKIYIATQAGIYEADTSDFIWADVSYNLEGFFVNKISYSNGFLYACTNQGLFKIDQTITGVENPHTSQAGFLVYPNPASAQLFVIAPIIPAQKLSLVISDLNGRNIFTVRVHGGQNAVQLNPELQNGIYFCWLLSGKEVVAQQKLVILK